MLEDMNATTATRLRAGSSTPGWWLAWVVGLAAAVPVTVLASIHERFPGDHLVAGWLQSVDLPGLGSLSTGLYQLGLWPAFAGVAVAAAAVLFCARYRLAALFIVLSVLTRSAVVPLKELAERPRPTPDLIQVSEHANGFSFPSGHVLGSVLLWGFLCYLAAKTIPHGGGRLAVQATCLSILFLTGLQRVYAGAHWPSDVLGGYLWGGLLLFVIVKAYELCEGRLGIPRRAATAF